MAKCCSARVAQMNKRLTIQTVSRLSDGQGGFTERWVNGDTVSASIAPYSGYQKFQAMQMQVPITHKIGMRFRAEVVPGTRLKFGDRVFWVQEALNVNEDGRFLEIKAVERVSEVEEADIGALLLETGAYLTLNGGGRILLGA